MTYNQLTEIVSRHGLTIDVERLVTGARHVGFFQFEITGPVNGLKDACAEIRKSWHTTAQFVSLRNSDIDGVPYLLVDSFYDDTRPEKLTA